MKKLVLMLMLIAPLTAFAQKFGEVDMDAVAQVLPEFSKAQGDLQAMAKQADNELNEMSQEIQRQFETYQKQSSTMNATAKSEAENKIQELQVKFEEARQQKATDLQKAQQEKLAPIQTKVQKAIENVGNNGGYTFIALKGSFPFVGKNVTDVTEACKTEVLKIK